MRYFAALLVVVACEKSGPIESTPGVTETTTRPEGPTPVLVDAGVQTMPSNVVLASAPTHADEPADSPRARREREQARIEEDAQQLAEQLTMVEVGTLVGDMTARRPGGDLDKQIADVRDAGSRVAVGGGARVGGPSVGTGKGIGDPDAPAPVDRGPTGRVSITKKQAFDDTSLTPEAVLAKMQAAYMAGIKRCYKAYLKKDPTARGKVKLTFTVNEIGRTVSAKAAGFVTEVDDCLAGMMASWRFPIPKDLDGEPTDAAFQFELVLVPD